MGHLGDGRVAQRRADDLDHPRQRQLTSHRLRLAGEEVHLASVGLGRADDVADGNVVGHRRRDGQTNADDPGQQPLQAVGLHVEADPLRPRQLRRQISERRLVADDDDLGRLPRFALGGDRQRRLRRAQLGHQGVGHGAELQFAKEGDDIVDIEVAGVAILQPHADGRVGSDTRQLVAEVGRGAAVVQLGA